MSIDEVGVLLPSDAPKASSAQARLIVAWQHPESRLISAVGVLEAGLDHGYRFQYLRRAGKVHAFQPFLGFPDLTAVYESDRLFPFFAQRIMSDRRPDFSLYLRQLHLDEDASPWEQMARSEGRRTGDTVQLFPVPTVRPDGSTTCRFLVHGIRHVSGGLLPPLRPGAALTVLPELTNSVNSKAVLVCSAAGQRLGYVPDMLLEHLHVVARAGAFELVVEHVNGPEAPPHLRLLARLEGMSPSGYRPMAGPGWETFVE
jgi:hypothetical protein